MATFDRLDLSTPDGREVAAAALAMADFDAKSGDYASALEWLGVAELYHRLPAGYATKKTDWDCLRAGPDWRHFDCSTASTRRTRQPLRWLAGRSVTRRR